MKLLSILILSTMLIFSSAAFADGVKAKLYKNPSCFCCEAYAKYLQDNGYEVEVISTDDLPAIKQKYKVPQKFEGCHTTVIGDYIFEGHIPVDSVNRVLKEKPAIKGLSVPGMPTGTPGMGGPKRGPLNVYELSDKAEPDVYHTY